VHRNVSRKPIERFDQIEEVIEPAIGGEPAEG